MDAGEFHCPPSGGFERPSIASSLIDRHSAWVTLLLT
jgi:hypothetical protein